MFKVLFGVMALTLALFVGTAYAHQATLTISVDPASPKVADPVLISGTITCQGQSTPDVRVQVLRGKTAVVSQNPLVTCLSGIGTWGPVTWVPLKPGPYTVKAEHFHGNSNNIMGSASVKVQVKKK